MSSIITILAIFIFNFFSIISEAVCFILLDTVRMKVSSTAAVAKRRVSDAYEASIKRAESAMLSSFALKHQWHVPLLDMLFRRKPCQ